MKEVRSLLTSGGVRPLRPAPAVRAAVIIAAAPAGAGILATTPGMIRLLTRAGIPAWTRGVTPEWTRAAVPGTRGAVPGATHVVSAVPAGAVMRGWIRGVIPGWMRG